jgi:hypothetical protein
MREQVEADVRDYLHEHPGELLGPGQVAARTGHNPTSVSGVLRRLSKRPAEHIKAEARGAYRYGKLSTAERVKELPLKSLLEVIGSCEAGQLARDETGRVWVLRAPK